MTPEQFKNEMARIAEEMGGDKEIAHSAADELLCKLLKELGYGEGVLVFETLDKWYA